MHNNKYIIVFDTNIFLQAMIRDADLLDLMNWGQEEGRAFQQRFRFLKIVTPVEFLQVMEQAKE